jgi:hypothetical protein
MPLIDLTYFVSEINIPNAGTGSPVDSLVTRLIRDYEPKFLRLALGEALYDSFMTGLQLQADGSYNKVDKGVADPTIEQKWKDLLNGTDYTDSNGRKRKWKGFVRLLDGNPSLQSPIAQYVYFYFMKTSATQSTSMGEAQATVENATVISPRFKMTAAWNSMHGEVEELMRFLKANVTTYPEWTFEDQFCTLQDLGFINPFF